MSYRFLGSPPKMFSFFMCNKLFRKDSRKCGALVPKKQLLYHSKKELLNRDGPPALRMWEAGGRLGPGGLRGGAPQRMSY